MSSLVFVQSVLLFFSSLQSVQSLPTYLEPRLANGLAPTPPMGWNSYNHYSCDPTEAIVHSNAKALVDLGLAAKGYKLTTVDCGWTLPDRLANGSMTWNTDRFPNGFINLATYIHSLGLKFGVYSDAGIEMCMTGTPAQVGSLGHEVLDADTYASWGADALKYDNCYSEVSAGYPDVDYSPIVSPSGRYKNMSNAILAQSRPMLFQICDWGVDFPSAWAPALGNTWRVTNDIIPAWRTIPRILNQVAPQTDFAGPEHWLDLDMLEVGNNVFTTAEEQTHFSLWAIAKSPLVIGAALSDSTTAIATSSLNILLNSDVIGYNQDSLGVAASFKRRWTEDGYEVWAGPLSGSRTVVALINLEDQSRTLTLDLPDVGIQKAATLKDIWNGVSKTNVLTSYSATIAAHGTLLVELGRTTAAGTYVVSDATVSGTTTKFTQVYGITTSASYKAVITFSKSSSSSTTVTVNSVSYTLAASSTSLTATISLSASNSNTVTIVSSLAVSKLVITNPTPTLYPSTSFTLSGGSTLDTCSTGLCTPVGSKIGWLSPTALASISITASVAGTHYLNVYFTNNDIAISTSWTTGTNTRNLTVSVNGVVTRCEVPLSGRSSELFSVGLGWEDTGVFNVSTAGWVSGVNEIVVGNVGGADGVVTYAADFVGLGVY